MDSRDESAPLAEAVEERWSRAFRHFALVFRNPTPG